MNEYEWITKRVNEDQHTQTNDELVCRLNSSKTTSDDKGMKIPETLLTPTVLLMNAWVDYTIVVVPTSRSLPIGSSQGTDSTTSSKEIRFKRMAGESSKANKRKGKKVKIAKTIIEEEDSQDTLDKEIDDYYQNIKEVESRNR
ncbi:hypothetical protein Tco_1277790 [Tanacetum coccineum]